MRIALIQMPVLPDKVKNIQTACGKIREAAKNGADFAVLPEMFCCPYDNSCFGAYGEPEGGEAPDGPVPPGSGAGALPRGRDCAGAVGGPDLQHQLRLRPRRPPAGQAPEGPPV